MKPNTRAAFEFLKLIGPPRVLVAIEPDTGYIVASTPNTPDAVKRWILHFNAGHGIYFTVNRTWKPMRRKPRKADIKYMEFVHAEYDPPAKVSKLVEWRRDFREQLHDCLWPPTFVWDSGNGVQALWRLKKPLRIGSIEQATPLGIHGGPKRIATLADCESVNQGMLDLFHNDAVIGKGVQNIDRILRVPGTVNHPNSVKRKAGRKRGMAGNVEHHPERVYTLNDLPRAKMKASQKLKLEIGAPVALESLFELKTDDGTKYRIENCNDDGKYPSRSEAEFAVICALVRDGIPDETILGILLDPRWKISERVLEKGNNAEKSAMKEIASAHAKLAADIEGDFADA